MYILYVCVDERKYITICVYRKEVIDGLFRIVKEGNTDHSAKVKRKFIPSGDLA
jgi:hypothetical protein